VQIGQYVRVPVRTSVDDMKFPRTFAMAQIKDIDTLAETVKVKIHDLFGCKSYYDYAFAVTEFPWNDVVRCRAPKGCIIGTPAGSGTILSVRKQGNDDPLLYYVSIPERGIITCLETDLRIDFSQMDVDPIEMLSRYELQNPSWFACRYTVSSTVHVLNNAVYGFKVLAGCRVFLLPHQVVTIVRCFETNAVRYMLADEVGLGKTIEACSVIKIMHERNPNLRVLYVTPMPLVDQWRFELFSKFSIEAVLYKQKHHSDQHVLISLGELAALPGLMLSQDHYDVLVVDETHQLLTNDSAYECIRQLSEQTEHVLFLSATPIQDRKAEYLRLLTLLDPQLYGSMSVELFGLLVQKQQDIQRELYLLFDDIKNYADYADSVVEKLKELADMLSDNRLMEMVNKIDLDSEDAGLETAYQAASYISEHYRLERHVIRNRRALLKEKMPTRTLVSLPYTMAGANEMYGEADAAYDLLQWLQEINDHTDAFAEKIVLPLLAVLFSSPWALMERLNLLKKKGVVVPNQVFYSTQAWLNAAEGELNRADELLDDPDSIHGRLLKCMDYLEEETDITSKYVPFKVLVFTRHLQTVERFLSLARHRLGDEACVAFYHGMSAESLQDSVESFQSDDNCRLMVCDELGGEGRNFQMADIVVHLDTPWTANMLEQRIGRLDRLGRDPEKDVVSVVIYADNTIEEQIFQLWNNGMNIYTQSLSGLEIITGDIADSILAALKDDVTEGLGHALTDIQEKTERMRSTVKEEQYYDMASMLYRPLTIAVERMLSMYQGKEDEIFADAMSSWAAQAGFKPTPADRENTPSLMEFRQERFSPSSSSNAFLAPPKWDRYTLNPQVIRKGRIMGTYNRALAIKREDLLFYAPGDPIFDTIVQNAMTCYRGRACAIEIEDAPFSYTGLVLVWNVEPNMTPLVQSNLDPIVLAQFRTFLPMEQIITLFPLNKASQSVQVDEKMAELLAERYRIRKATHLGKRSNSSKGTAKIQYFVAQYPEEKWVHALRLARRNCREKAKQEVQRLWDYNTAVEEARRIVGAFQASNRYFGYEKADVEQVKNIYRAVLKSLKYYELTLDSAIYMRMKQNG